MLALVLLAGSWPVAGPYVLAALLLAGTGTLAWWLWRTDRQLRGGDADWRRQEEVRAGRRTLAEADGMSGTAFEELVAGLCRRDGCTEVRRVGGAGDHGADVVGRLPDGRTVVVQCKRYATSGAVPSRDLRELLGTQRHFCAEAAVFVTTTRFTAPAEAFARQHGILAVHRDHLGLWHSGTPLTALFAVNGAGQGDRRHRARWKKTYGM
ncbi:hypothetical protein GCM10027091_50030 [Streptomyces daliensis]